MIPDSQKNPHSSLPPSPEAKPAQPPLRVDASVHSPHLAAHTSASPSRSERSGVDTPPVPRALDAAILRALLRAPEVNISPNFAAGVARRAVAQPLPDPHAWTGWGPRLALASSAVLTTALFAFAPHAAPNLTNLRFDAEIILLCELSGLGFLFTGPLRHG